MDVGGNCLSRNTRAVLEAVAGALTAPGGGGVLLLDQSPRALGRQLSRAGVADDACARLGLLRLLCTAGGEGDRLPTATLLPGWALRATADDGRPLATHLRLRRVAVGSRLDGGDELPRRCAELVEQGVRFARVREVFLVGASCPEVSAGTRGMAVRASACQAAGVVPLLQPQLLPCAGHSSRHTSDVAENVLSALFAALSDHRAYLEGVVLMASLVPRSNPQDTAATTSAVLCRTVPPAVGGVVFLPGCLSQEQAVRALCAMNTCPSRNLWPYTFALGRDVLSRVLGVWAGLEENFSDAQEEFIKIVESATPFPCS